MKAVKLQNQYARNNHYVKYRVLLFLFIQRKAIMSQ